MEKIVAFIPVRGGSKGIPNKNIKDIAGKPLVYWTANAASQCELIDKVYVSTDSDQIKSVVNGLNLPKVEVISRSEATATDTASTESALLEFTENHSSESVILIQATSPLLTAEDLTKAVQIHAKEGKSLLSVVRQKRFIWKETENGTVVPVNYDFNHRPRRQEFDGFLVENGAFYITKRTALLAAQNRLSGDVVAYEMAEESYYEIDEPEDWKIIEQLLLNKTKASSPVKKDIKLVLTDVDGVLTDAGMYYSESGDELKKFNTHDGMAFKLLREAGYKTGIVTSEVTTIVENRAKKLKADFLYQGKEHGGKLQAAQEICKALNISLDQVAYIGDDINCFDLLNSVGLAACPANALPKIKSVPAINVLTKKGGEGVFREFVAQFILE
ncbi:MAG: acylneuraminate cytidylyltransferase [Crocinitomicaceae bacterium]|nr:acylneuraminate cytidylyltransferase [Crocinitomicaceae bacterium]|tara:strand:+ start:7031 stop:8191 length:1161 start_codon:yes stop_codon:yes gene_type:complete